MNFCWYAWLTIKQRLLNRNQVAAYSFLVSSCDDASHREGVRISLLNVVKWWYSKRAWIWNDKLWWNDKSACWITIWCCFTSYNRLTRINWTVHSICMWEKISILSKFCLLSSCCWIICYNSWICVTYYWNLRLAVKNLLFNNYCLTTLFLCISNNDFAPYFKSM